MPTYYGSIHILCVEYWFNHPPQLVAAPIEAICNAYMYSFITMAKYREVEKSILSLSVCTVLYHYDQLKGFWLNTRYIEILG